VGLNCKLHLMLNKESSKKIASLLLEIKAIKINTKSPFKWSSGWNSPIYCDNRLSLSYPETRDYIKEKLIVEISNNFPEVEAIAGVATAGIPQGALVADNLKLPFIYVRSKPKGHGLENLIEGKITKGQKVVIVEDLVSTGGSSLKAAEALRSVGFKILGMIAIFTYGFNLAEKNFKNADLKLVTLSDYPTLIEQALIHNFIQEDDLVSLKAWKIDPENWEQTL